jgi:Putative capsular polysaccharide synthesis protein
VYIALRDNAPNPVFKAHLLRPEALAAAERDYRDTDRDARPRHLFHGFHLVGHPPTPAAPWLVVTMVREPIARAVSDFFQTGERLGRLDAAHDPAAFGSFLGANIEPALRWFEREFEPTIGVDVYAYPFDAEAGVATIGAPQARVLVLRQESLDVAPHALGEFLGLDHDIPVAAANVGAAKTYGDEYERVVRNLRVPSDVLDTAYESKLVRHFYSPAEIERFRARWEGAAAGDQDLRQ